MAKKKRKIGVFCYDLFPYRVTHDIKGFDDNGNIQCEGFAMSVKGLECVSTGVRADHVEEAIAKARADYRTGQEGLRKKLMSELLNTCPELDKDKS